MSSRCFTGSFVYLFFYVFSGNNPRYSWLIVFYKEHVSWAAMTLQNKYSVTPADTFWNAEYLVVQRRKFEFHAPFDVPQFFEQLSAKRNFQTRKSPEWNRKLKHIICFWLLFLMSLCACRHALRRPTNHGQTWTVVELFVSKQLR